MTTRDDFEKWAGENWIDGLPKMIALRTVAPRPNARSSGSKPTSSARATESGLT